MLAETEPVPLMDWEFEPPALDAWRLGTTQGFNNVYGHMLVLVVSPLRHSALPFVFLVH